MEIPLVPEDSRDWHLSEKSVEFSGPGIAGRLGLHDCVVRRYACLCRRLCALRRSTFQLVIMPPRGTRTFLASHIHSHLFPKRMDCDEEERGLI